MSPNSQVDTSRPHPARVYDYLLGGKDHYEVDSELGERIPGLYRDAARVNRAFMHRAVAWVARDGVDQYLDIGTGIPTEPNLHQVVQEINPASRILYADNDPLVLRHAQVLLISAPQGATDYIQADAREPERILEHARKFLDFDRPIALSLVALLHFVLDEQDPYGIVRTLVEALPTGSYLVLSHGSMDFFPEERENNTYASSVPSRFRSRAEVERFFDGLDLVDPGLVTAPEWYKDTPAPEYEVSAIYSGVARVR
ncbi:hypothetical protein GCM10018793_26870 [Streptomyces sulfonofaciens]|uniref:SAM-dependent methyltransferase n=1 Tax=Streptomyces sulfonofaciens TaxID=68272 RepID=A0A919KYY8_9ACTN|nr:SAM-dependent methyltransferase [Streptomyces sulfonofaciens]GHH77832.1 hypothetical protein GCM10018793_26870 [Streptomyces sulfonofaciens]